MKFFNSQQSTLFLAVFCSCCLRNAIKACSPLPGAPTGPYIGSPYPIGSATILRTITEENMLWTTITSYDNVGNPNGQADAILDLQTGLVTAAPSDAETTVPPPLTVDPTGGFKFSVQEAMATLTSDSQFISVSLEAPELFALESDPDQYFFFFSNTTQRAYILYKTILDCTGGSNSEKCTGCPKCTFVTNRAAIVNLADETVVYSDFDVSNGLYLEETGPWNSLTTVYDDIQIASVGIPDSCGGVGHFFYDETQLLGVSPRFSKGNLGSLKYGATPKDLISYSIIQQEEFVEAGEYNEIVSRYVISYEVAEYNVLTGDTLQIVELDPFGIRAAINDATSEPSSAPVSSTSAPSRSPIAASSSPPSTLMPSGIPDVVNVTTVAPTTAPSESDELTNTPSFSPIAAESSTPSTLLPSGIPTVVGDDTTIEPTPSPSVSDILTDAPSSSPLAQTTTSSPSAAEIVVETMNPSEKPSEAPSITSTSSPTTSPSVSPSESPSVFPTAVLVVQTGTPTSTPTLATNEPTRLPVATLDPTMALTSASHILADLSIKTILFPVILYFLL